MKRPGTNFTFLCFFQFKSNLFPLFEYSNSISKIYISTCVFRFFLLKSLFSKYVSNLMPEGVSHESCINLAHTNLEDPFVFQDPHLDILWKLPRIGTYIGKTENHVYQLVAWGLQVLLGKLHESLNSICHSAFIKRIKLWFTCTSVHLYSLSDV